MTPRPQAQPKPRHTAPRHGGVPRLVVHLAREWRATLDRALAGFDLTSQQAVLLILLAPGPVSPNQLTESLGTDTAGMTRLIDRLEAKGFAVRSKHPHDRRAIVIHLTPKGENLVPQLAPIIRSAREQLLTGFSPAETEQLEALLERLLANLTSSSN